MVSNHYCCFFYFHTHSSSDSYFTVIRYTSAVDSADFVVDPSRTVPCLAVLCEAMLARASTHPLVVPATNGPVEKTVRPMLVAPCALVPTCAPYTSQQQQPMMLLATVASTGPKPPTIQHGHQQTWGQVSFVSAQHISHTGFSCGLLQIWNGDPSQ